MFLNLSRNINYKVQQYRHKIPIYFKVYLTIEFTFNKQCLSKFEIIIETKESSATNITRDNVQKV